MIRRLLFLKKKKTALVLGSGGARGIAHIAAIDYIESLGIKIDIVVGSSIGSLVGALYCNGSLKEFKKEILDMPRKKAIRFVDPVFNGKGLIAGNKIMRYLERYIQKDTTFSDLKIPLLVVTTDYLNGMPNIIKEGNVLEAVRASISVPGVFVPPLRNGRLLIDGGLSNPLPVDVASKMGATRTIAINLNPPVHTKNSNTGMHKTEKIPNIFETIMQTVHMFEHGCTMAMLKNYEPDVLIEPKLLDMKPVEFSNLKLYYEKSMEECRKSKQKLIKLI